MSRCVNDVPGIFVKTPETLNNELADELKKKGVVTDAAIESAFRAVPRHLFLPDLPPEEAYSDRAIATKLSATGATISSSSQPTMMALMLEQLQLKSGHNVLEIGTGTGYNAALMQHIVGHSGFITSLELDTDLSRQADLNLQQAGYPNVKVVQVDGAQGYAPRAAYDRIIATVGVWDVPQQWLQQLKPDGRLIVPIWLDGVQVSTAFVRQQDNTFLSVDNRPCAFVYLRGDASGPEYRRQVGNTDLYILADESDKIDTAGLHTLLSDDYEHCSLGYKLTTSDFWYGFQIYLMLNEPAGYIFAVFAVTDGQKCYGIEGRGLALFAPGSASFVPYHEEGYAHCFGGSDAYLMLYDRVQAWHDAGKPGVPHLRLQLIPKSHGEPATSNGKIYPRRDHYLHVWLES